MAPERDAELLRDLANRRDQRQRSASGSSTTERWPPSSGSTRLKNRGSERPVVESIAVDIATAAGELDQHGVDDELVPALALRRGARCSLALAEQRLATSEVERGVPNRRGQLEDRRRGSSRPSCGPALHPRCHSSRPYGASTANLCAVRRKEVAHAHDLRHAASLTSPTGAAGLVASGSRGNFSARVRSASASSPGLPSSR